MDDMTGPAGRSGRAGPEEPGTGGAAEVNIQKLADKVYRLMIAEARLERARGRPAQR